MYKPPHEFYERFYQTFFLVIFFGSEDRVSLFDMKGAKKSNFIINASFFGLGLGAALPLLPLASRVSILCIVSLG